MAGSGPRRASTPLGLNAQRVRPRCRAPRGRTRPQRPGARVGRHTPVAGRPRWPTPTRTRWTSGSPASSCSPSTACGRQADALRRYERLRRRLAEELGADPVRRCRSCTSRSSPPIRCWRWTGRPGDAGRGRPVPRQLPPRRAVHRPGRPSWPRSTRCRATRRPADRGGHRLGLRYRGRRQDRAGAALGAPGRRPVPGRPAVRQPARLRPQRRRGHDRGRGAARVPRRARGAAGPDPGRPRRPGRASTAACSPAGGCWCCSTTPGTPTRSARCSPAAGLPGAGHQPQPSSPAWSPTEGARPVALDLLHRDEAGRLLAERRRPGPRRGRAGGGRPTSSPAARGCRWRWRSSRPRGRRSTRASRCPRLADELRGRTESGASTRSTSGRIRRTDVRRVLLRPTGALPAGRPGLFRLLGLHRGPRHRRRRRRPASPAGPSGGPARCWPSWPRPIWSPSTQPGRYGCTSCSARTPPSSGRRDTDRDRAARRHPTRARPLPAHRVRRRERCSPRTATSSIWPRRPPASSRHPSATSTGAMAWLTAEHDDCSRPSRRPPRPASTPTPGSCRGA